MPVKILDNLAMFLLIGLAALRPIVAERYDSAPSGFGLNVTGIADPLPLTTVIFDVLILTAALLCMWARAVRRDRRYRWTGLEAGTAVVAVAGIASCFFASNSRLALNATIDWICMPVATITLVQLLRSRRQRQLVVMAILASAFVQVWQVFDHRLYGLESMWEQYVAGKEAFWHNHGIPIASPTVELFERRIQANEAQGFFPHSNVASAYLVLCVFVAGGVALDLWRRVQKAESLAAPVATSLVVLAMLVAIALTKSLGGFVSLGAGLLLLAATLTWRRWIDSNRGRAFALGWIGFAVGVIAVVGHGMYHDSLPGASLNFRWQYWTASSELVADHPWTGVGRENFGRNYLRYKSIESPEEVANPHNLFVQAASDWGLVGLAGVLLMCGGATRVISRRPKRETEPDPPGGAGSLPVVRVAPWAIGGLVVVTVGRFALLGSDNASWVYYQTVTTAIAWLFGFFLFAGAFRSLERGASRDRSWDWESSVPIALFTFFLHEMINFATFVPGTAYTFFGLLACAIASRVSHAEKAESNIGWLSRWTPVIAASLSLTAVGFVALMPVARADHHLRQSRSARGAIVGDNIARHPAAEQCELAGIADPIDPTPLVERAKWMMGVASIEALRSGALRQAESSLNQAIQRDRENVQLRRMRLRFYLLRTREADGKTHFDQAILAAHEVLELYPQSPPDIIALADAQLAASRASKSKSLAHSARESYRRALALDDQRPEWEIFQRLPDSERDRVSLQIAEAQAFIGGE